MSRYLERLSENTILCWSQGRNRASKCVTEEMTRLRRLCVFCWRQLIGSRNKTNLQPVKLIASSNSTTRTRGVWGLSWGRGKRCSRVCPPPPPHDINTTPSHNHNTRYLSSTPYWSYGPSSLDAVRVQNRLLLLLSTNVLLVSEV